MKHIIAAVLILVVVAAAFTAGHVAGVEHAIVDAVLFTVEAYDPCDPYANRRPDGTDQTVFIELDGEVYEHGMYQG